MGKDANFKSCLMKIFHYLGWVLLHIAALCVKFSLVYIVMFGRYGGHGLDTISSKTTFINKA